MIVRPIARFNDIEPSWTGESIEDKVRRVTETNAPIEAISPMIYTERKDGVQPQYNIRTDKWEIAQEAMDTIAQGKRQKRAEKIAKTQDNGNENKNANESKKNGNANQTTQTGT